MRLLLALNIGLSVFTCDMHPQLCVMIVLCIDSNVYNVHTQMCCECFVQGWLLFIHLFLCWAVIELGFILYVNQDDVAE